MRKLLFLLVGVLVAFAANANLYLMGPGAIDSDQLDPWTPSNCKTVTAQNGYYTFKATQKQIFQLSKSSGNNGWDGFNSGLLYLPNNTNWSENNGVKSAYLTTNSNNANKDITISDDYIYVRVKADYSTIEICQNDKFGETTTTTAYKLKGTFTGNSWPLVALPCEYSFDGTQGEQEYGIGIEGKNDFFCNGTTFNGETLINTLSGNNGNDKIVANFKGTVRFEIVDGNKLKVSKVGGTESTAPAAFYFSYNDGRANDTWKHGNDMTKDGNKFTAAINITQSEGFVTFSTDKASNWSTFGTRYSATSKDLEPTMGTAYEMLTSGDNCWKLGKGTYTITVDFSGAKPMVTFTTGTPVPVEKTYTIYYYDQQARGSITVRIWDEGDQHHREEAMTPTGKYVYDGTNYWPAYSYTFTTTNIPAYVRFKDITGDLGFTNGAFYTHNRTYPSTNYQLVDRRDDDYVYLYFNFCEDWLTKYDKNFVPHCHVYNKDTKTVLHPNGWATDLEAMTNVRYQIWEYKVPANRIDEFNDAIFYVKEGDKYIEYTASVYETTGGEWDAANWTKYIYAPSREGDKVYTRQTYLTYAQFTALDATRRQNLYLLGEGGGLPSWDIKVFDEGLTENKNWFKEDNGVFYIPLSMDNNGKASFKLSWINPHDARVNNNYGEGNNLRMWGTFDLGLIGVDDLSKLFDNGTLDKSYIDGNSNNCYFTLRTSLPYNNYNQFDWVVDTERTSLPAGNYWIVVDTHAECRTLTMISFDPNPSINVVAGEISSHDITFAQGAQIHSAEDHLLASANNGHQAYNRVNIASGSAEITAAASDAFRNEFDVEYSILMNGEQVLLIDYVPGEIALDYLPAAQNVTAGVRATYTNHRTGLTFHSRTGLGTITGGSELVAPQIGINTAKHLTGNNPVDGVHNVHAVVMAEYTAPATEFANFVDFEANAEGITDAILIDKNNDWVNDFDEFKYLGQDYDAADWTRNDDLNSFDYQHCWAALIRDSKQLPFYLPNVKQVTSLEDITATDVNVTAYAVYPFLINPRLNVHPQGAPRRAAAARISIPEDLSGYNVVTIPVPATTSAVIPAGALTGISDIAADTDADAEYFTLQGVRVQGELAPGVYIRRMGNKADKVYIR